MDPVRALLFGIVDYAGLFPPSALPMADAVREYAAQRLRDEAWMLAAFVVPAARLTELGAAMDELEIDTTTPWPLSVLLGAESLGDLGGVRTFEATGRGRAVAFETKATDRDRIVELARAIGPDATLFVELPWNEDVAPWMPTLRDAGAWAKIRTGGVTADAFPPVEAVARFLRVCAEAGVGLKFTAGLHHPVRSQQALTYDAEPPRGVMHGFLNVFTAAALLARGEVTDEMLHAVLTTESAADFRFDASAGSLRWRDQEIGASELAATRQRFARSFGSCSFREPVEDLQTLGML